MAVAAVDPVVDNVVTMIEANRLRDLHELTGDVGRPYPPQQEERPTEDSDGQESEAHPGKRVRTLWKGLHRAELRDRRCREAPTFRVADSMTGLP